DETQDPEHIVVAGGGVVAGDDGQQVGARGPARFEVEAAAFPLPVAAPEARGAADGEVVVHRGAQQDEGRVLVLEDPAPLAVLAPAGPPAARACEVGAPGAADEGERRPGEVGEPAAPPLAAIAAGPPRTADRLVVADCAVADGDHQAKAEGVERVEAA